MVAKNIEYRPSGIYVRYVIPKRYKHHCSVSQLRCRLPNLSPSTAARIASQVVCLLELRLGRAVRDGNVIDDLTIKAAMRRYVAELNEQLSDEHLLRPIGDLEREAHQHILVDSLVSLQASLASSSYPAATADAVCAVFGLEPSEADRSNLQFLKACREWSIATTVIYRDHLQRLEGNIPALEADMPYSSNEPLEPSGAPRGPLASTVLKPFLADRSAGRALRATTIEAYKGHMTAFTDVLGDIPVDAVSYDDVTRLRDTLLLMPKNRHRVARYRGLTADELVQLKVPQAERLQGRTVQEILAALRTVFQWLVVKKTITSNPFEGVLVATKSTPHALLTPNDIHAIFSSPLYQPLSSYSTKKTTTQSHWWLPLLCLHTGARPSELLQMRLEDVSMIGDVVVAAIINDAATGQQVKTLAGQRLIPIHPALLALGFMEFVVNSRQAGEDRVLHGIPLGKRKAGDQAGKWWTRYKTSNLSSFVADRKTLYSFRHTFITKALNEANVPLQYVQQIVGHERSQMGAAKSYDYGGDAARLLEELSKVDFALPTLQRPRRMA